LLVPQKLKILVVAQTPPPFHGQAIMTEYFLQGAYDRIELHHIRMAFSEDIEQVGRAGLGKVFHLFALIGRIAAARVRLAPDVLYFPPAGPNLVPFLRDCVLLIATRWMFPRTAFHFHAAGLPGLFDRLPGALKILFRLAYRRPHVAISISKDGLRDAAFLGARRTALVPNGIPDVWQDRPLQRNHPIPQILFLAMVCEEKGAGVLIDACRILMGQGVKFSCQIAGRASSEEELKLLREKAKGMEHLVEFVGPVTGDRKWDLFARSDVFCFPTYYASESFGLVAVESMMAGLPVVTSDWRALPEIVDEGQTGFLVPVKDAAATADRLRRLLDDPALRQRMGGNSRERFLNDYRVEVFHRNMENALASQD
jgi:glycosyltransferase involved in cell wall biosynthesis